MWRTVMQLEWRILRRDRAAIMVLAIFALFLIVASFAGGRHAQSISNALERSIEDEAQHFKELRTKLLALEKGDSPLKSKDPRDPVWMGKDGAARIAALPPAPLAPIAVGQRDLHPQAVRITTSVHLTAERETETPMSGPSRLMGGAFDPAFLFVVLFPLVVIALSYELLSGERERGTLAMLLSQPVSQSALVLGKAVARAIAIGSATLIFALVGLVIGGAELTTGAAWLHVSLYFLVLILWALFWLAAAIAVNAWGPNSARNALTLVGLWLVLVVVVPGLVNVGVDAVHPPPSRIELMHEAREAARDVERELTGLVGRHDVDLQAKSYAKRVVKVQNELAQRAAPVLTELRGQLHKRQSLLTMLRFVSPAIVVQLALEDVAGAGALRHQRFERQVDALHESFRSQFSSMIADGRPFESKALSAIPQLEFQEEPAADLIWRILSGVLGLLVLITILIAIARPGLARVGRLAL